MLHQLIQKIGTRLPGWKRRIFSYPGRELLVKSILTSIPTYFLTVYPLPKWGISKIDRFRRGLFWKGHDLDNLRGHCPIN
jgi:hypothetical protein